MMHLMTRANLRIVRQFAWSKVLLAFDYDGTLAPIVDDPAAADMRARTRELFTKLTRRYPCAVISGRSQPDVARRLRGVGVVEAIGNHGLEPARYEGPIFAEVRRWIPILERRLARHAGVVIEDKTFSIAVHYRRSREKRRAVAAIRAAIAELEGARVVGGKMVVNLVPEGAPHKGMALRASRARFQCDTAIYIGDDETDEDVFTLDEPGRLLCVRVEESASSQASYFLRDQVEIDTLLEFLLSCRDEARGRPAVEGGGGGADRSPRAA